MARAKSIDKSTKKLSKKTQKAESKKVVKPETKTKAKTRTTEVVHMTDAEMVAEWLKKNKVKKVEPNVGGENVVKHFFVRRKKKAATGE